jgi:hypothetical protein
LTLIDPEQFVPGFLMVSKQVLEVMKVDIAQVLVMQNVKIAAKCHARAEFFHQASIAFDLAIALTGSAI